MDRGGVVARKRLLAAPNLLGAGLLEPKQCRSLVITRGKEDLVPDEQWRRSTDRRVHGRPPWISEDGFALRANTFQGLAGQDKCDSLSSNRRGDRRSIARFVGRRFPNHFTGRLV